MSRLTRIVPYAQQLLADVLSPGDLAVDLTAGNGHDTLFLQQQVTSTGHVVAFDIHPNALDATTERLHTAGVTVRRIVRPDDEAETADVTLVAAGHETCADYLKAPLQAAIANLGYLPGNDKSTATRTATSLSALVQISEALGYGGRLAVVVYPGHPGGDEESAAVESWFSVLPRGDWDVLKIGVGNCAQAPFLLVAEKRRRC